MCCAIEIANIKETHTHTHKPQLLNQIHDMPTRLDSLACEVFVCRSENRKCNNINKKNRS